MQEISFHLENVPLATFYGAEHQHLKAIQQSFPKLKIVGRDQQIKASGTSEELTKFQETIQLILLHIQEYNRLNNRDLNKILKENHINKNTLPATQVILHGTHGKYIKAQTTGQVNIVRGFEKNDMVFAIGPAGTGKTYTGVALAVKALKEKSVRRIILTRPAVEAGENLGFLPGDLKEKLDPYLQPLYDALRDMIHFEKLESYLEKGIIEIAPLAFMRGRTLDDAFVILDEGQNTTIPQMKMFLTRMGSHAKFMITGDPGQVDLPGNQKSGLLNAVKLLENVEGIEIVTLDENDIVRHGLVNKILKAYQQNAV